VSMPVGTRKIYSNLAPKIEVGRLCNPKKSKLLLSLCIHVCHAYTRDGVRLLGPCYKTGRIEPFSQRPGITVGTLIAVGQAAL